MYKETFGPVEKIKPTNTGPVQSAVAEAFTGTLIKSILLNHVREVFLEEVTLRSVGQAN